MSNIHAALGALFQRLERLETATHEQELKVQNLRLSASRQPDLFNAPAPAAEKSNVHVIDPALLARKLDVAIEKVEQVLQEG